MSTLFNLSGKIAIVTGSSRGIGKAIAHRFAEHGARVVVSSRNRDACETACREINSRTETDRAVPIPANIGTKESLRALVGTTEQIFGAPDILVCNAATNPFFGPMSELQDEQFMKVLTNNILSTHWLTHMVVPGMRRKGNGAIIYISSIGGLRGSAEIGAYNVSKAADMQLARNLALEFGRDNIRTNTIAPGYIRTHFSKALWEDPTRKSRIEEALPLGRLGEPDDIAGLAVLLASDAGSYITGQTFVVDGGLTA
jgi:NAD(P)-dependent dehydrogenase (short-subunit alcohol dehydrogenase family)